MVFIAPPNQKNKKNSPRRTLQNRQNTGRSRTGMGGMVRNSLHTSQGVSTFKLVVMYSILGMVLNWILPIVILKWNPEIVKEDSQYFGTLAAIIITVFFLVISLLKGLILSHRSKTDKSKTQDANAQLFGPKNLKK